MRQPTFRAVFANDPLARIVSRSRSIEDDFSAFAVSAQESTSDDAPLVDDAEFRLHDVAVPDDSGFTHFLDGAQRSWRAVYHGMYPIYLSHTSAALLRRSGRDVQAPSNGQWLGELESFVPRTGAGIEKADVVAPAQFIDVEEGETPLKVQEKIVKRIGQRREEREVQLGRSFEGGMLLLDGGIGRIVQQDGPTEVVGLVKTHSRQYFRSSARVAIILSMKPAQRTSVFVCSGGERQGTAVYGWYLKLRDSDAAGPMFGVVRIEVPQTEDMLRRVDEISGWVLAERTPLSLPDARHDRLLYPIRLVEMHLKARQPSDAAIHAKIG